MRNKTILALASALATGVAVPATAQDYYLSQIIHTGYNFCPRGFANTDGQILSIAQNTALFSLLGTTYGGNGQTTFALPDIRGRLVIGTGQGPGLSFYDLGQRGGVESQTLTINQMPQHVHQAVFQTVNAQANSQRSNRNSFAITPDNQYTTDVTSFSGTMNDQTVTVQKTGGTTPIANLSPFTVTRYCIAIEGIFPTRN
jgi:microcystin-dependent protein